MAEFQDVIRTNLAVLPKTTVYGRLPPPAATRRIRSDDHGVALSTCPRSRDTNADPTLQAPRQRHLRELGTPARHRFPVTTSRTHSAPRLRIRH